MYSVGLHTGVRTGMPALQEQRRMYFMCQTISADCFNILVLKGHHGVKEWMHE